MYKNISALMIAFLLSGCSDGTPMKITHEHKKYVGVWQQRYENAGENALHIDNMLLAINSDGTAVLRACEVDEKKTKNSKTRSRYAINFPAAAVTEISQNKITLVQEAGWFGFEEELAVDKAPYRESEKWYIGIKGKRLVKLGQQEIDSETDWDCPDDDEDDEKQ
jgi:hypothetical protein